MSMKLEDFYFYSLLSDESQRLLKSHIKPISLKEKAILYYAGDVCTDVLVIESGNVRVFLQGDNGEVFTLYTLGSDEMCIVNTFSTIFASAALANAEVLKDLNGWLINKEILMKLLQTEMYYSNYVFSLISENLSSLINKIETIKFSSIKDRLEDWIFSQPSNKVKTTHEEIAMLLGTNRPFISKLLKDMEKEEKIKLHRGFIEIL
ncbi:MAG: Crp/Fnr family transcriptional regulator [Epsilonproteobacteria bacterium]|nr:Crp/Fnr family transcriptional regulator [Campylobacterota bacterium]